GRAAVVGKGDAAVVAEDQAPAVSGIDPQRVMVRVRASRHVLVGEGLAAVVRYVQRHTQDVHSSLVAGIDSNLAEIERAWAQVVELRPRLAAVVGAKHTAGFDVRIGPRSLAEFRVAIENGPLRLHDGVDDTRILGIYRDPATTDRDVRQAVGLPQPGLATIGRLVDSRFLPVLHGRVSPRKCIAPYAVSDSE